jgi:Zn-dependent protease
VNLIENSLAPPTRFDLNFRIGDIPVRVHPFFWLSTVVLGWNSPGDGRDKLIHLLIWVALVFISILIHELGHILMGRWFGNRGHIVLAGFCGLAVGSADLPRRGQRIAVSLAGPGAGFVFAALVAGISWLKYPDVTLFLLGGLFGIRPALEAGIAVPPELLLFTIGDLLWINVFWGLVNLLPIWPLDGGQVCREICAHYRRRDGMRLGLYISLGTALGLGGMALIEFFRKQPLRPFFSFGDSLFPTLFFALLAIGNWQLLQVVNRFGPNFERQEQDQEPLAPWEQDADWWKRG